MWRKAICESGAGTPNPSDINRITPAPLTWFPHCKTQLHFDSEVPFRAKAMVCARAHFSMSIASVYAACCNPSCAFSPPS